MHVRADRRSLIIAVAVLIAVQTLHSTEEFLNYSFYDRFPVFRLFERLFSSTGQGMFFAFNISLVMFLALGAFLLFSEPFRARAPFLFALIELMNGLYHAAWTLVSGRYFPGTVTGLLFIPAGLYILVLYRRMKIQGGHA